MAELVARQLPTAASISRARHSARDRLGILPKFRRGPTASASPSGRKPVPLPDYAPIPPSALGPAPNDSRVRPAPVSAGPASLITVRLPGQTPTTPHPPPPR